MQTLIRILVALTTVQCLPEVKDGNIDGKPDVDNALYANTATDGIHCNDAVNSLFAHTAGRASIAEYADLAAHADYATFAMKSDSSEHAFRTRDAKYAQYTLYAYKSKNIVKSRRDVKNRTEYQGDRLKKIEVSAFMTRDDNCSLRCGKYGDGRKCTRKDTADTAYSGVNSIKCLNAIHATKAKLAANAAHANISLRAKVAAKAINAVNAKTSKTATKKAKTAVYAYFAETSDYTENIRPDPNAEDHKQEGEMVRDLPIVTVPAQEEKNSKTNAIVNDTEDEFDELEKAFDTFWGTEGEL